MSTKLIASIVGVVIVVGAGFYFFQLMGVRGLETSDEGTDIPQSGASRFSGTMTDLLARGGSYKCVYSQNTDGTESSGTVYTSGNMMRGDFMSTTPQGTVESHMVTRDGYFYSWSSAMPTGMKIMMQGSGSGATGSQGDYTDVNQQYDYDCDPWSGDATQFSLPAGVNFMEFGGSGTLPGVSGPGDEGIYCTQDAKLCPDGKTYVGRRAPSCEFAACPGE